MTFISWQKNLTLYSYENVWIIIIHNYIILNAFKVVQKMTTLVKWFENAFD